MLGEYLKNNTSFIDEVSSWEESVKVAAKPLLEKGFITQAYIQDMIKNININGPYVVIVPGIAMPHAKNEGGVIKTGISFLKLNRPVLFPEGKEVSILLILAAEDTSGHLDLISDLSSILVDEEASDQFKNVSNEKELINLIKLIE